ncbi:MAG: UDP-N-acetylglucosamine 2-epimerase, partial [Candidatus Kariarchaeaceae archaeon]
TLAVAIAASYSNIPLAHTQGGEWTGSIDNKVRYAVTQLADYHFVATEKAKKRLLPKVHHPSNIHNVGCPSIDLAKHVMENTDVTKQHVLNMMNAYGTGYKFLPNDKYTLIVYHPDTTMDPVDIQEEVDELYSKLRDYIGVWILPNIDAGSEMISKKLRQYRDWQHPKIRFITNLPANDYLHVMRHCQYAIGNSSSFIREGSYMGTPTILIGSRQSHRELGPNIAITCWCGEQHIEPDRFESSELYGNGTAAKQIVEIINGL